MVFDFECPKLRIIYCLVDYNKLYSETLIIKLLSLYFLQYILKF